MHVAGTLAMTWVAGIDASHQDTCICYKKLKKLNCDFIVPFDRFPATFVAPKLFVTVALSSHCCRAACEYMIARAHARVSLYLCEYWAHFHFALFPPGLYEAFLSESIEYS